MPSTVFIAGNSQTRGLGSFFSEASHNFGMIFALCAQPRACLHFPVSYRQPMALLWGIPSVFFSPGLFLRNPPIFFFQNRQFPLIASTQWLAAGGSVALPDAQNFPLVLFICPAEGSACSPRALSCRRETSALLCSKSPPKRSRGCTDLTG